MVDSFPGMQVGGSALTLELVATFLAAESNDAELHRHRIVKVGCLKAANAASD